MKVMFLHLSVILSIGGCLGPGPGWRLQGLARGWCPGPHQGCPGPGGVQAQAWGCIPACTETDTPSRRLLLRAVRILLECILVLHVNFEISKSIICDLNHSLINYYKSLAFLHYTENESKRLIFTGEMELHNFLKESDLTVVS